MTGAGPLAGIRVVELAGMGPGPHAATLLADLGADVVRVQRAGQLPAGDADLNFQLRNRGVVEADLKRPEDLRDILGLVSVADVLIEGFRPGVAERLGIGPDECLERNPALVYARMTGWGQTGPDAHRAGHDINYLASTGLLDALGRRDQPPTPPANLLGDFGGGSLYLVIGILAALTERQTSGRGQVIDAAIVDGASHLGHVIWSQRALGRWNGPRGTNVLDTGAPFYDVYETADHGYMAVGSLEPPFFAALLAGLGLDPADIGPQRDEAGWPAMRAAFTAAFAARTRAEWTDVFAGTDACVTPVLRFDEAGSDPQLRHRQTLIEVAGAPQPAPAPRFSRTPAGRPDPPARVARPLAEVRSEWAAAAHAYEPVALGDRP